MTYPRLAALLRFARLMSPDEAARAIAGLRAGDPAALGAFADAWRHRRQYALALTIARAGDIL